MSRVRNAYFSGSWYPGSASEVYAQLDKWEEKLDSFEGEIISGIVPHAGWFFSGMFAYDVIRRIDRSTEVLVVLGGHLPEVSPFLFYDEDYIETPCGNLEIERSFISHFSKELLCEKDTRPDNTIEVQLPMIKALFKNIKIVPVRVPAGRTCLELVHLLEDFALSQKISLSFLGSTDLTHYGPNYNFIPEDSLKDPLSWVKQSDKKILEAMVNLKPLSILEEAALNQSACSAGAAACAAEYAFKNGVEKGQQLIYDTSFSKHQADSFVGYGTVIYES